MVTKVPNPAIARRPVSQVHADLEKSTDGLLLRDPSKALHASFVAFNPPGDGLDPLTCWATCTSAARDG